MKVCKKEVVLFICLMLLLNTVLYFRFIKYPALAKHVVGNVLEGTIGEITSLTPTEINIDKQDGELDSLEVFFRLLIEKMKEILF